ncbi:hypothetical protein R69927_05996 [Paraburkholderia domus]|uniref:phenol hydroxylase subunit n=1 Tax=Paraburkholderia domus TaxID=2793075 RepID=UPI001912D1A6|nr:phenol hydroxylase subunit [Paraburkholderia domus]MBK5089944.1 phenol hydroxylase [Burkholderia sp. R-69927]CAE6910985.1 hypothetical protein R69927_05996 [Paraburkholderia domus]
MYRKIADNQPFDPRCKFVTVTGINGRGFVEFEFAIGAPELFVELMLPPAEFEAFCLSQDVLRLDETNQPMINRSKQ